MSSNWDNVQAVQNILFRAGSELADSASIYVNGYHQIPASLYISFIPENENAPLPTEQEIIDAITWVNFETGAPIKTLKSVDRNDYCLYYDGKPPREASSPEARTYQYAIDFQFTCTDLASPDSSDNLSLILNWSNKTGDHQYDCSKDSSGQDMSIHFQFTPQKKYGKSGDQNVTHVIYKQEASNCSRLINTTKASDVGSELWCVKIDDPFFHIHTCSPTYLEPDARCYVYREYVSPKYNKLYNTYFVTQDYGVLSDQNIHDEMRDFCDGAATVVSTFNIVRSELYFLSVAANFEKYGDDVAKYRPVLDLVLRDQFGNPAYVSITCDPTPVVNSVR